jgi:Uma2 family endonuclease
MDEYLAIEERNEVKHEYVSGVMYAMAGARASHNRMVSNIALAVGAAARSAGCDFFAADMKVRIGDGAVYYPDLMVCCTSGPHRTHNGPTTRTGSTEAWSSRVERSRSTSSRSTP